jgi:hypothetical protein
VIIADDGSSDGTRAAIANSAWSRDPRVLVYANRINVGKGCAVRLGLSYATGDIILIQDAESRARSAGVRSCCCGRFLDGRSSIVYGTHASSSAFAASGCAPATRELGSSRRSRTPLRALD